jgi:hypothetical protein
MNENLKAILDDLAKLRVKWRNSSERQCNDADRSNSELIRLTKNGQATGLSEAARDLDALISKYQR